MKEKKSWKWLIIEKLIYFIIYHFIHCDQSYNKEKKHYNLNWGLCFDYELLRSTAGLWMRLRLYCSWFHVSWPKTVSTKCLMTGLWIVVLQAGRVRGSCEERNLHLGHQRVIDSQVGQTQSIWRPPVGNVGLQDLLWKKKTKVWNGLEEPKPP